MAEQEFKMYVGFDFDKHMVNGRMLKIIVGYLGKVKKKQ